MTEQEKKELRDIQGFIEFCIKEGQAFGSCLATVGHDVGLLLERPEDGSAPRTSGYAEFLPGHRLFGDRGCNTT